MKKIFTLLVTVCFITTAFAQRPGNRREYENGNDIAVNNRDARWQDHSFNDRHFNFYKREMELKVADINALYERKISEVRCNWFMNRYRKQRYINELETRRSQDINSVYASYNDKYNDPDHRGWRKNW